MPQINGKCPCTKMCKERKDVAVNLVLKKEVCTSTDLKAMLLEEGLGKSAIRKSIEFLSSGKCDKIDFLYCQLPKGKKPIQFVGQGRLFFKKYVEKSELKSKILCLLTPFQKRILEKFTKHHKDIYYFSLYDLRKLSPYPGISVIYAVQRLSKLGWIKIVRMGGVQFCVESKNLARLRNQEEEAVLEDKTEYVVVKKVHELVMNLYPSNLITNFRGVIRPSTGDVLGLTGGMAFDIFYQLNEPIGQKRFLAIDVYTRIPVTGFVVNSFIKKIEWASTKSGTNENHILKNRTFGMIVYRNSTPEAIRLANKNGIRFLRLSDIKVKYEDVQKEASSLLKSAR